MALIELRCVSKTYALGLARVHALQDVDLSIEAGEFSALWGPSGSGKSSLLNLIGLIDTPTRGEILLQGERVAGLSDAARAALRNRSVGFVFQSFNLLPVLSALENVMLPLLIRGESRSVARRKAQQRLAQVGLAQQAGQRPDTLSGGQRQRVAVARALAGDPAIVVADEPTANLDSDNSRRIVELMRELNRDSGVTFLFSTHDPRLLEHVDRRIGLADGRLVGQGATV